MTTTTTKVRLDHAVIAGLIAKGSTVLDLGCGTGDLLAVLVREKEIRAQGIEIDEAAIYACVEKGLSVLHGDIDTSLSEYRDKAFDYVILNQSLQQVRHLDKVFTEALRVGKRVIVGIPNFAHYRARLRLFFKGKVPVTKSLPYTWYETPNLHFLSLADFVDYCREKDLVIERRIYLGAVKRVPFFPNLFADVGIFVIMKR